MTEAMNTENLGYAYARLGDNRSAAAYYTQAMQEFQSLGDTLSVNRIATNLRNLPR